jgi:transitional endoplasmic reticulum ATPase
VAVPERVSPKGVELKVMEAKQKDVGQGRVRIDRIIMEMIGVKPGDVVEIEGKRVTAAIALPAYPEDQGLDIIRMDGLIRKNAGVSVGDKVFVRKAKVKEAKSVKLAPANFSVSIDEGFIPYAKKKLLDRPVVEGDTVMIPILGQTIPFVVTHTKPGGVVRITRNTNITILEKYVEHAKVPKVTWEDIGGLSNVVQKLRELIELPMRYPEVFKRLGIEPPKGVLLYGPPGTGKTMLAKALANEIGAYFIAINGPEIMSKYYGESEQRLREIFEEARKNAPSIIFIDEIDAIAPKREEVTGEVEKRVVAQLLTLMDGLQERGRVVVIGATNRPNAVDPALRRPGRFDREIEIPPPDKRARKAILEVHTRNVPLAEDVDLEKIAEMTHGYTGADLAALVKEAAMNALRRFLKEKGLDLTKVDKIPASELEKLKVSFRDFLAAMKVIQPTLMREVYIEVPEVHWEDIGGLEEVKQQLKEAVVWPLKHPEFFTEMGIEPPKGILLFGPPGTGKTLLAKAAATESQANFIAVRGPEILSKWVGESEKAIREIFRKARQAAPTIVFFDEIDSIATRRGRDVSGVLDRIVNQLLTEMDGIEPLQRVTVIAATNRPDLLDPALLRPGRFDRLIYVPPPDKKARLEIFRVHTRRMPLADDVDLEKLAEMTQGYTGADIAALCREAALIALRENLKPVPVSMKHFEKAMKAVKPSLKREDIMRYEKLAEEVKRSAV